MHTVYLAGPINGCTDAQAIDWRRNATLLLSPPIRVLSPMARDYRGKEDENVSEIVEGDKADIDAADTVLVNANGPSWGTAMEVLYAHNTGKRVIAFTSSPTVSPWLRYHCTTVCQSLSAAVDAVRRGAV
jgi:nucleoside 2-deoxyribosyltransferase